MTAIGIRYLCGYAVAAYPRGQPEWPPHPGRVFMALGAAHFETGADPAERGALGWLEKQPPPDMKVSHADRREAVTHYVPVNDREISAQLRRKLRNADFEPSRNDIQSAVALLPERRPRQQRTYPRVRPHDDTVFLVWNDEPPADVRRALASLCAKVTRIGHSSSLVQMWLVQPGQEPAPDLLPTDGLPECQCRVVWEGCLQALEEAFSAGRRPVLGRWQGYGRSRKEDQSDGRIATGLFEPDLLIFAKESGPELGLESTLQVTGALRNAAIKASPQPVPEWLSGHKAGTNGPPSQKPHLAFLPLPSVGHEHADGHLLGTAIAVPRGLEPDELRRYLGPLLINPATGEPRLIDVWKRNAAGKIVWRWTLQREIGGSPRYTLRSETWSRPSRLWASVTPVVLHHYPKKNRLEDAERIVREACHTAMLLEPLHVAVGPVSWHRLRGPAHVRQMPRFEDQNNALSRYHVHVLLEFQEPVQGPVLIGRGRYRGYGLCRPLSEVTE